MAVGAFDLLPGALDNTLFSIHCMKKPDYVLKLMTTYPSNKQNDNTITQRTINNSGGMTTIYFKYPELLAAHTSPTAMPLIITIKCASIEVILWATKTWQHRVFAFLLALTEVNLKMALEYFADHEKLPMLVFRRSFARSLINNRDYKQVQVGRTVMVLRLALVDQQGLLTVDCCFKRWNGVKFVR
jgi:hypothetical protein